MVDNNRVYIHYLEFNLGYLTYKSGLYFWFPNVKNINSAQQKYVLAMDIFYLPSEKTIYEKVPDHFKDFLSCLEREDLVSQAGIEKGDDNFTVLCKLSKLNFFETGFIIKDN